MFGALIVIVGLGVLMFILSTFLNIGNFFVNRSEKKQALETLKIVLRDEEISKPYEWEQFDDGQIILNDIDDQFLYFITPSNYNWKGYEEVEDVELVIDDSVEFKSSLASTAGRAVVGGALAGGVGAIIGGATAKKTGKKLVHRIDMIVTFNEGPTTYKRITLLNSEKGEDIFGDRYNEAYELGLKWSKKLSTLKYIPNEDAEGNN